MQPGGFNADKDIRGKKSFDQNSGVFLLIHGGYYNKL
jgi:hypothetical protein